jgi:predicted phage tail protein
VGEDLSITINWFPSFNSQYNVERYQVAVTPDPTPSCTGSVSPNVSYTCSGLSLDIDYTITVSAINCGDQEGENNTFSVQLQGLGVFPTKNPVHNIVDS